mmetsp:Transcript_15923/g.32390  ORF Transcript_15923/g.32390 Transcript_15923/m.32390 type:complete len:321 (-) Transcript_15923:29-991(-)
MWRAKRNFYHITRTSHPSGQNLPPQSWRHHTSRFIQSLASLQSQSHVGIKPSYDWWQRQEKVILSLCHRRRHVRLRMERFNNQMHLDGYCTPFPGLFHLRNSVLFVNVTDLQMNQKNNAKHVMICRAFYSSAQANKSRHISNCNRIQGTLPIHGKGIKLGQYAECRRIFSQEDVSQFGNFIGDLNSIHFPSEATENPSITTNISCVDRPIVHGILLSSLFSSIFGTLVPGSIYRSQTLQFQSSVHVDVPVIGRVTVIKLKEIRPRRHIGGGVLCDCETKVFKYSATTDDDDDNDEREKEIVCVMGEAQVWLPGATIAVDA